MLYTDHALYHWRCVYFFVAKSSRWWVELDRQKWRNWPICSTTTLASYFFLNKSLVIRKWNPLFLYWNLHTGNIYIYTAIHAHVDTYLKYSTSQIPYKWNSYLWTPILQSTVQYLYYVLVQEKCSSTKRHVHMHVHKNTCTHTCPRALTNWCWFLSFRVLISSVNHEFIRETADRLSVISLLKWCSNMYKNFLYKIICIWFTTQAFTIIIMSVNKGNRRSSSKSRFTNQNLKLWNHTNVYTETDSKSNFLLI